jgi:predicted transcriptional regulator
MTDSGSIKPDARRLVENLPESASWDDLAYEVYVRQSVEAGLADSDAGRVVLQEEALRRVRAHIRRAS